MGHGYELRFARSRRSPFTRPDSPIHPDAGRFRRVADAVAVLEELVRSPPGPRWPASRDGYVIVDAAGELVEPTAAELLGGWMQARRRLLGLTQAQAAASAGITRQGWARLEAGTTRARPATRAVVERALIG